MQMKRLAGLLLAGILSGCSVFQGTPQPPPPLNDTPQQIQRNQTQGLQRLGTISVIRRGSPDDSERAIYKKAVAAKADYYVILLIDETVVSGQWYAQAILYRK
ncbi:biofilm peroxide resistance protein BsmA [Entomohabitans teleogrylli]|uniref:biofilm peroxide resistance protein BsmA n=1 Tax=Entomohabitans teleogrylli TaxID=1384589 RepID=UPI00073D7836|nr:biofilm peroxide resistance protein BsmA [Entomohabitans teleogrylli]